MAHHFIAANLSRGQYISSPTNSLQGSFESTQLSFHVTNFQNSENDSPSLWEEKHEHQAPKRRMLDNYSSQVQSSSQQILHSSSASPSSSVAPMQKKMIPSHIIPPSLGLHGSSTSSMLDHSLSNLSTSVYHSVPYYGDNPLDEPSPLGLTLRKTPSLLDFISLNLSQKQSSQSFSSLNKNGSRLDKACSGNVMIVPANISASNSSTAILSKLNKQKTAVVEEGEGGVGEENLSNSSSGQDPSMTRQGTREGVKSSSLPISSLSIGDWKCSSNEKVQLKGKFLYSKQKLIWEIPAKEEGRRKMEMPWLNISFLSISSCEKSAEEIMEIKLCSPPSFYLKKVCASDKERGAASLQKAWQKCTDFTKDQQATHCLHHVIRSPSQGLLFRLVQKALSLNQRLATIACILNSNGSKNNGENNGGRSNGRKNTGHSRNPSSPSLPSPHPHSLPRIPLNNKSNVDQMRIKKSEGKRNMEIGMLEEGMNSKWIKEELRDEQSSWLQECIITDVVDATSHSSTFSGSKNVYIGEDGADARINKFINEEKLHLFQHLGMFYQDTPVERTSHSSSFSVKPKDMLQMHFMQKMDSSLNKDIALMTSRKRSFNGIVNELSMKSLIPSFPTDSSDALDVSILFDLDSVLPSSLPSFPDLKVMDCTNSIADQNYLTSEMGGKKIQEMDEKLMSLTNDAVTLLQDACSYQLASNDVHMSFENGEVEEMVRASPLVSDCSMTVSPESNLKVVHEDFPLDRNASMEEAVTSAHACGSNGFKLPKIASASELLLYLPKIASLPKLF